MTIRKGPYGWFLARSLEKDDDVCEYAMEVIESGRREHFLPVYINKTFDGNELMYDFTGLMSVNDYQPNCKKQDPVILMRRRTSIGDLFLSIIDSLDQLMNPALLILDPEYVYTDSTGTNIRLCYCPLATDIPIKLSSICRTDLEHLLDCSYFSEVLTDEETSSIIYAVANNDEDLLEETANKLKERINNKTSLNTNKIIIFAASVSAISLAAGITGSIVASLLTMTLSLILLLLFIYDSFKKGNKKGNTGSEISDTKSRILFDDSGKCGLNAAFLESIGPEGGAPQSYAIYQDCTTIGSDRFLSDIYINSNSVSPIHAQIYLTQDTVYLSDCSADGKTFIDDHIIAPEIKHEIKNGQKLTFGDADYRIKISFV